MKKRTLLSIIALLTALFLLAGCGSEGAVSEVSSEDTQEAVTEEADTLAQEETESVPDQEEEAEGPLLSYTVDGVELSQEEADLADGTCLTTSTNYLGVLSSLTAFDNFPYRTALYINGGTLEEDNSVTAAVSAGDFGDTALTGGEITSASDDFSGVIVNGSDYTISQSLIQMLSASDGQLTNDFAGLGAAVLNTNGGVLTIEDSDIATTGVAKLALLTDNGANTILKNSTLSSTGGTLYEGYYSNADQLMMVCPPWVLGMDDAVANARTTNMMGKYTTSTYVDCTVYAGGWGALSTDSDADYSTNQHLVVINTDVEVENAGYGSYAVTEGVENYYGVTMDVATYGVIMTGGMATFESYTGGQEVDIVQYDEDSQWIDQYTFTDEDYPESGGGIPAADSGTVIATVSSDQVAEGDVVPSSISSGAFGFMCHSNYGNGWNVVELKDGTDISTGDAVFLVKKVNADLYLDNVTVNSDSGVILQVIDNDDDYVGPDMSLEWGVDNDALGRTVGTTSIEDLMAGNPCHFPTFNEKLVEPAGWSYEWTEADMATTNAGLNTTGDSGWEVNLTVTNTALTGDIWNSSGYVTENGGSSMHISLGSGATLEGIISSGAFKHTIQEDASLYVEDDSIDAGGYYEALVGHAYADQNDGVLSWANASLLGHVTNTQYANGYNGVSVELTDDAVWTVTGTCLLDTLSVGENAQILGADGAELVLTVDGAETAILPGTVYEGEIVLTLA